MTVNRLSIIGVGLIGGSLARALKKAGHCNEIIGSGRSEQHLRRALELGVIDRYEVEPEKAVQGADVVVIATPLGTIKTVLSAIRPALKEGCVVTDAGSAKVRVVEAAQAALGDLAAWFVPGHPIAGNEKSGVDASVTDLFNQRRVILTPQESTNRSAVAIVTELWKAAGAEVFEMKAEHHDEVLAATSHLPHVLAFGLVESLSRLDDNQEVFQYAAGGFRDFTRIASSDPVMWRDICLSNSDAIARILQTYIGDLKRINTAIQDNDGAFLLELFKKAQDARQKYVES